MRNITEGEVIAYAAALAGEGGGGGGTGDGDMKKSVYDSTEEVKDAGGIKNFVQDAIPTDLSAFNDDSTHRLVTDAEKDAWNAKSDFSGSYNDLTDKPTLGTLSSKNSASGNITPEGSIEVSQGTDTTTTVNSISAVGTLPSFSVDGEAMTFNPGTLPTKGENVSVVTASGSVSASFTGTESTITVQ